eukprot:jgi/Tetstr1/453519/TSEL_040487.t1
MAVPAPPMSRATSSQHPATTASATADGAVAGGDALPGDDDAPGAPRQEAEEAVVEATDRAEGVVEASEGGGLLSCVVEDLVLGVVVGEAVGGSPIIGRVGRHGCLRDDVVAVLGQAYLTQLVQTSRHFLKTTLDGTKHSLLLGKPHTLLEVGQFAHRRAISLLEILGMVGEELPRLSSEGGHLGSATFNLGFEENTRLLTGSNLVVNSIKSVLQRSANARRPAQRGANARRPAQRGANARRPAQQGANARRPAQRGANVRRPAHVGDSCNPAY